jgi:hypothetical protein
MKRIKDPVFRDMIRTASCMRSENGSFLKDKSGKVTPSIQENFKKFSFLKETTVRRTLDKYLNNIDRGI